LSKFAAQLETLDMSDERNLILYMFTNVVYLQQEEINALTPMQMRFYEECQISNFTNMEKQDYVKSLLDYPSVHEMVECERAEAKEEGIQIGIQMGIEQGIEQGRVELICSLIDKGFDVSALAEAVGMSEADVRAMTATPS
jgi:predicted transposase/invertase (TIGR01784 family)